MGLFNSKTRKQKPERKEGKIEVPVSEPEDAASELDLGAISQDREILQVVTKDRPRPPRRNTGNVQAKPRKPPMKKELSEKSNIQDLTTEENTNSETAKNFLKPKKSNDTKDKEPPPKPPRKSLENQLSTGDDATIGRLQSSEDLDIKPDSNVKTNFLEALNKKLKDGPSDYALNRKGEGAEVGEQPVDDNDDTDAVHHRLALDQNDSVSVDNTSIKSVGQDDKTPKFPKKFLKPRKSLKILTKLGRNLSRSLSKESTSRTPENENGLNETEEDEDTEPKSPMTFLKPRKSLKISRSLSKESNSKTPESENDINIKEEDEPNRNLSPEVIPHQINLMAELSSKLKKSESVDAIILEPEIQKHSEPNSFSVEPEMMSAAEDKEDDDENMIENMENNENPTVRITPDEPLAQSPPSSPASMLTVPQLNNLQLRPNKPQRTVTSIRLEEAFSMLEDELFEEPRLSNIREDVEENLEVDIQDIEITDHDEKVERDSNSDEDDELLMIDDEIIIENKDRD